MFLMNMNGDAMKITVAIIAVILSLAAAAGFAGRWFCAPSAAVIGNSEHTGVESVLFDGVHGWYIPSQGTEVCVLLMHGVHADRRSMMGRALWLRDEGYTSLAIDLQAHGETVGDRITFGYREADSARHAVHYLYSEKSCAKVVTLGSSLGGAASLLGKAPIRVDGYILEAVYPSIEKAVENRLTIRLGPAGAMLAPLLYLQIPLWLDIERTSLQPIAAIKTIKAPILVINGTEDARTTLAEARKLFDHAPDPKFFYPVAGAGHVNLFRYQPETYKKKVITFLNFIKR